ncbi:FEN1-like nuclease [Cetacean poxvirus 1]|nr:FEN1-like nuclease [Cetacean poxvirus 1]
MGIKYLKTLLLNKGYLTLCNEDTVYGINIFVDTMSFYVTVAYCVDSFAELKNVFVTQIDKWQKDSNGSVTLFIDVGDICIKRSLREKRRTSAKNTIEKKSVEVTNMYDMINKLDKNCFMYEEQVTDIQLRIQRLNFQIDLLNISKLKGSLYECIKYISNCDSRVTVVYCNSIDAEFRMCIDAQQHASEVSTWPLLISADHDTLMFSSLDELPKYIKTITKLYKYIPCAESKYLSNLTALVNGCDFFTGLHGMCITSKSLVKITLYDEFTLENVIKSLVIKNYTIKTTNIVDVNKIISFIKRYSELDETVYHELPPTGCTIQEFIFSALNKSWTNFKENYYLYNSHIIPSLVYALPPRKEISTDDLSTLINLINASDINNVKILVNILGYDIDDDIDTIILSIVKSYGIMLCYNNLFYYNDKIVIKNSKTDIINIGY